MHAKLISKLTAVPLFSHIPQPDLEKLAAIARQEDYAKNAEIMAEGERSSGLYIVLSGKVKVVLRNEEGKEIILAMLSPTEYFGEMALLDDAPRSADVVAMVPTSVLVISKQKFNQWLLRHPDMSFVIIRTLAQLLREAPTISAKLCCDRFSLTTIRPCASSLAKLMRARATRP